MKHIFKSKFLALGLLLFNMASAVAAQDMPTSPPPDVQPPPIVAPVPTPEPPAAPRTDLPDAKIILAASLDAVGGKEKSAETLSFSATATLDSPTGGKTVLAAKSIRNGAFQIIQHMTEVPSSESIVMFDGQACWVRMPTGGFDVVDSAMLEQGKTEFDLLFPYWLIFNPLERFETVETVDQVTFNNVECFKLRLQVRGENRLERFGFYDVEKKLIQGITIVQETPMGAMSVDFAFGDWTDFDGRRIFTKMTVKRMGQDVLVDYSQIGFNSVEPSLFEQPEEVKEIIRQKEAAAVAPPGETPAQPPATDTPPTDAPPTTPPAPEPVPPPVPSPPTEPRA